jgi:hypothetical protein
MIDGSAVALESDTDGIALRVDLPANGVQVLRISPR